MTQLSVFLQPTTDASDFSSKTLKSGPYGLIQFQIKNSVTDKLFKCDVANHPTTEQLKIPDLSLVGPALFMFKSYGKLALSITGNDYSKVQIMGYANQAEQNEDNMYVATVTDGSRKRTIVANMAPADSDTNAIAAGELNLIDGGAYGTNTGTDFKTPIITQFKPDINTNVASSWASSATDLTQTDQDCTSSLEIKSFSGAADYGNTRTDASYYYSNTAGRDPFFQETIPYAKPDFAESPASSKGTFDKLTMFMDDYFYQLLPSSAGAVSQT